MSNLHDLVHCVDREISLRAKHYPRWVLQAKMTPAQAEKEYRRMWDVRDALLQGEAVRLTAEEDCMSLTHDGYRDTIEEHMDILRQDFPEKADRTIAIQKTLDPEQR